MAYTTIKTLFIKRHHNKSEKEVFAARIITRGLKCRVCKKFCISIRKGQTTQ